MFLHPQKQIVMIVGRKNEQRRLREAFASDESEFVAVYGRRRAGKHS